MGASHLLGAVGFLVVGIYFIPMFYKLRVSFIERVVQNCFKFDHFG